MRNKAKAILFFTFYIGCLWANGQAKKFVKPIEVYKTTKLKVIQISAHAYVHISYKQTTDFGYVPCNGLIVINSNQSIVFDTPTNDSSSLELIKWITENLHCTIKAIVPTHFHDDCLGGLQEFHQHKIPSFANKRTIELAKQNNMVIPENGFIDSLVLTLGNEKVTAKFFGEGHTKDNVVGYFAKDEILFGGCLIKELNASKGYLGDANLLTWSSTVSNVKKAYPNVKIVVPGHGNFGNKKLLNYTINLFKPS